jgi:hypothetical protein
VPLRRSRRGEAELAPGDAITCDRAFAFQMVEIGAGALGDLCVAAPSLRLNQI